MIEVFDPPLYFAWRWERGLPYVVHFYITRAARSLRMARWAMGRLRNYFKRRGLRTLLMNARSGEPRVQHAIEYYFKTKAYAEADEHKFYLVEV